MVKPMDEANNDVHVSATEDERDFNDMIEETMSQLSIWLYG